MALPRDLILDDELLLGERRASRGDGKGEGGLTRRAQNAPSQWCTSGDAPAIEMDARRGAARNEARCEGRQPGPTEKPLRGSGWSRMAKDDHCGTVPKQ